MRWSQKIGKPVKLRRYIDHADDIRFVRRFNAVLKGGGNFAVFFRRPESTDPPPEKYAIEKLVFLT